MSYEQDRENEAIEAARALVSAVSASGFDRKAFAQHIGNEHRTNQQSVMRAFAAVLERWQDEPYDARNMATVQFAKETKHILSSFAFPYI